MAKKYYVEVEIKEGMEIEAENEDEAKERLAEFICDSIADWEFKVEER
ncbi:MAG: hypothetical protein ACTSR2_00800 [Candidatus Hodarchaeales archaeon]